MNGEDVGGTRLRSVGQVLSDGRLATADAVGIAAAAAEQVAALHASGRVHGHLGLDDVLVDDAGSVVLGGSEPHRAGPAAPPELRSADLRSVGRILALGLGWSLPDRRLPVPVEDLLARAEASAAPAAALALALRRLQGDPRLITTLLPPLPAPVAARPREGVDPLTAVLPRSARRTAGLVAGLVAGVAVIGGALLLVTGTGGVDPAPTATRTAVTAPRASSTAAPLQDLAAGRPEASTSPSPTARPTPTPTRRAASPKSAPAVRPRVRPARPAPRSAPPARTTPRATRSAATTSSPAATTSPTPPRRTPTPSAPATVAPATTAPPATAPAPTSAPSTPPAPKASSRTTPRATASTAPSKPAPTEPAPPPAG